VIIRAAGQLVWAGGRPVGGAQAVRSGDEVLFAAGAGAHTYAWGPLAASAPVRGRRCVARRMHHRRRCSRPR
jgi:hypothetical protein